jgi:hypothetical protein
MIHTPKDITKQKRKNEKKKKLSRKTRGKRPELKLHGHEKPGKNL